jgi:hypothetical protein
MSYLIAPSVKPALFASFLCRATVVCADINEKGAKKVADALNGQGSLASGQKAFSTSVDVTSWASVVNMFKATEQMLKEHTGKPTISFVFACASSDRCA